MTSWPTARFTRKAVEYVVSRTLGPEVGAGCWECFDICAVEHQGQPATWGILLARFVTIMRLVQAAPAEVEDPFPSALEVALCAEKHAETSPRSLLYAHALVYDRARPRVTARFATVQELGNIATHRLDLVVIHLGDLIELLADRRLWADAPVTDEPDQLDAALATCVPIMRSASAAAGVS